MTKGVISIVICPKESSKNIIVMWEELNRNLET